MIRNRLDQAAGLRGLAGFQPSDSVRVITVTGGRSGVGKTSAVINLATALAKMGKRVLIIDENPCHNNVNDNLGLKARYELLHVINRDKTLEQVILQGADNIFILSAVHGIHAIAKLNSAEQEWLIKHFGELAKPVDVVLVDTAIGSGSHVLPFSLASQKVLIVLSKSVTSITDAYALIKIMSKRYAKQHFFVLVNKVESEHDAQVIFDHVSKVTQQYLSVTLDFIGYVQNDEKLQRSTQLCRAVIDAFPASQSAICFRQIAENIMHSCCPDDYGGGMENFMQRLIRTSHLTVTNFTV
ncbi:flagellar biosynthesis protein FlhG [Nitrosomonas cryotolerans]|uniref:Flagellar biosynthesis protein FlhG n=1 Tax=Nitrosomonas cryotolerans ATCC 49181 TaxID=1131553 RepID=A0A1N6IJE8_9PROT|nr:AAA family ATPase [Nitrosomonas cryotolerans]SFP93764.1 flagellar biosynthesis protein FlhG [Nitrosomonas cryotolerans]SIO32158.1 flagellar biosynthesis protein FlhG [Nitrosomonas cryotolerans ATCC 49181]